jgi:hypothetical protein
MLKFIAILDQIFIELSKKLSKFDEFWKIQHLYRNSVCSPCSKLPTPYLAEKFRFPYKDPHYSPYKIELQIFSQND